MSLTQTSPQYYSQNHTYEIFSQCEDKPWLVTEYLINQCVWKIVIDYGCGTWKYTQILSPYVQKIYAVDQSSDQIFVSQQKTSVYQNISYQISDNWEVKIDEKVDVIFCCWVLWTVTNIDTRMKIFDNLKKSLRLWGKIIFVENWSDSEFEQIRWKDLIIPNPTRGYNLRLINQWCTSEISLDTHFLFETIEQGKYIFSEIWGSEIGEKVTSEIIEHQIIIFEYKKIAN